MSFVCCFFCLHLQDRVQWVLCLISMHHTMMLLLCLQSRLLMIWWEWKKSELFMDVICVLFLLYSPPRSSWVSVVFDFNASNNNLAPVSSIPFSVFVIKRETVDCWWVPFVCCCFCVHHSDWVLWVFCSSSMICSMILSTYLHHNTLVKMIKNIWCSYCFKKAHEHYPWCRLFEVERCSWW